jgi:hypothetical protein
VTAYGGGTLIFDQYGQIKYHIRQPLDDVARQTRYLANVLDGSTEATAFDRRNRFALAHLARSTG